MDGYEPAGTLTPPCLIFEGDRLVANARTPPICSSEEFVNDFAGDIGEAKIAASVTEGQLLMVESQ